MIPAILTTILFALSAISGQRIAFVLGSLRSNLARLILSATMLALIVFIAFPDSLAWPTFGWFFFSGLIGFGVGDVALFLAYERIGSRLTMLLTFCLAPLFATVVEWLWLGNAIPANQMIAALVIVSGVAISICSRPAPNVRWRGRFGPGVAFGMIAGFGQGVGAVISRKAQEVEIETGIEINGLSEAFQRVCAGLLVAWIAAVIWKKMRPDFHPPLETDRRSRLTLGFWLLASAVFGPVIGVSCFQWALETMESGLVLSVVATSPIVMLPLAWFFERDRPTRLSVLGALIAVAGVILLHQLQSPSESSPESVSTMPLENPS